MPRRGLDRREFLQRSALAGLALATPGAARADAPHVRRFVELGKTGLSVCDVGYGANKLRPGDEGQVHHAMDLGINYFDTADSYGGGLSEETLGNALQGRREKAIVASKGRLNAHHDRQRMMKDLEASLRRLRTDYVDVYFSHAVNDIDRAANPEWPEFLALAKRQGKIRFSGMSGHGGRLVECVRYVTEHELVDVLLTAVNFGQDPRFYERVLKDFDFVALQPELPGVLVEARRKGIGVVAMKTLRGGRLQDLSPFQGAEAPSTFAQAALRWALSIDGVDSLVITMRSRAEVEEYLGASGWTRSTAADERALARYEAAHGRSQCRYGCSACLAACPAGVSIPEVLRTRMYADDYRDLDLAREDYGRIPVDATACTSCTGEPCATACPYGLPIPELTKPTARRLG